jgi:hypothetical protein
VVSLSDSGTGAFPYYGFWVEAFDSGSAGGALWGNTTIDLESIPGFQIGSQDALRFEASVNANEAGGDGFYVDDVAVRAVTCEPVVCAQATADTTGTGPLLACNGDPVTLDGSRSTVDPACIAPEIQWYDGTTPIGTGPVVVVNPATTTTYRLEARCSSPLSCAGIASVVVRAGSFPGSSVGANTLLAVRRAAAVEMTWTGVASGFNVAAVPEKTLVPTLVATPPLNPAPLPGPTYTDTPPLAPVTYYGVFGTDCSGQSVP